MERDLEKGIKRFLKRRVKITLGFVVAFLLSCTSFAVTEQTITDKNIWLEGLGVKNIIFNGSITTQYKVKIESDSNGGIKISFDKFEENFTFEISVSKDNISEKTAQIINNALRFTEKKQGESLDESTLDYTLSVPGYKEGLQLKGDNVDIFDTGRKTGENQKVSGGKIAVNKWIIDSEDFRGQVAENSSMGINYGIIANSGGGIADGEEGQAVMYNSQGINYGIIANGGTYGQYINHSSQGINYGIITNGRSNGQTIYNNSQGTNSGTIANHSDDGQNIAKNSQGINYGIINNQGGYGQNIDTNEPNTINNSQGINYGIIANYKNYGQYINSSSQGINYGIINNGKISGEGDFGQYIDNNSQGINYGIIANNGNFGQAANENSQGINYGIIANNGECNQLADNGADAENYGILVNKSGNVTKGNAINNGIILVQDNGTGKMDGGTNNGVIYNEKDNKINVGTDTFELGENKNISDITEKNIFINNIDKKSTLVLDNDLNENHITTIVKNDNIAVKSNKDNLTMDKSSIVGYFENAGTLLEFSGSFFNLTDSVISAIGKNKYTDKNFAEEINPVAIKFKNTADVNLTNSNIIGTVDFTETKGDNTITLNYVPTPNLSADEIDKAYKTYIENVNFGEKNDTLNLSFSDYSKINVNFGHINFGNGEDKIQFADAINMKENYKIYKSDEVTEERNIRENIFTLNEMLSKTENLETLQLADKENTIILSYDNFGTNLAIEFDGTIKGGTANDTFEVYGDMKTGGIDGGEGADILTVGTANSKNNAPISLAGDISNFENVNVNKNIKFEKNLVFNSDKNDTNINMNNNDITLGIDYSQKDENGKVIGHTFYNSTGIKFTNNENSSLIVDTLELTKDEKVTVSHGEYDIEGNFENLKTNSAIHNVKYGESGDILINLENDIPIVDGMENFVPLYESLNKIYHSVISADKLGYMKDTYGTDDGKTDDEAIKGLLEYYGKMYHSTPYAYSNEVSKKSAELITDSLLENRIMPNLNKWIFGGNIAGRETDSDADYYGRNYHKVDIGKNEVSAESNIYGAYAFGEYGIAENQAFGFAVAGTKGDTDISGDSKLESNGIFISAYAKQNIDNLVMTAGIGYQHSFYDSTRVASNDFQMTKIDEDYQDDLFTIFAGARYSYKIGNNIFIEPNAKLNVSHVMQDDINEGDSSEDITIEVDKEEFTSMDTEFGIDIVKKFDTEKGSLNFKTGVSLIYAVDGYEDEFLNAKVVGATESFEIISPENDRTRVKFNLGAEYELDNGIIYKLHGNYITSSDSRDYSIGFGIGYKF